MPKKKLAKKGFDWKDTEKFDKTASEVGGAIENFAEPTQRVERGNSR